jgi:2-polyprenyl-3-methyl-5-hydroxy-6-metoxy-1,4-benzoquinol methylase
VKELTIRRFTMIKGINEIAYKAYYEKGWESNMLKLCDEAVLEHHCMKSRLLLVNNMVRLDEPEKEYHILDVGCGVGTSCFLLLRKYKNTKFHCIDISEKQVEAGRQYARSIGAEDRISFKIGDVRDHISGKYDYIIASEIIEHLPDPTYMLRNVKNVCKDEGEFIFTFPVGKEQNSNIAYRIVEGNGATAITYDRKLVENKKEYYEFYHKLYSIQEAKRLLKKHGFNILKLKCCDFLESRPGLSDYFRRATNYSAGADVLINMLTLYKFAGHVVFRATS